MQELWIQIPASKASGYKVNIGTEILGCLWQQIEQDYSALNKFIVTDENLVRCGLFEKLAGKAKVPAFIIAPAGETSKNIGTVTSLVETMEKAGLGRDTLIVALGGGTVGDIAGFAAAIFKRGVSIVHIPTTTVAQADSALGGKTGVDSSLSKNAYGAFWHPAGVYIDVVTLKTLDDRQFRAGLVESVKHALIAPASVFRQKDAGEYFNWLENNLDSILARKSDILEHLAYQNCKIKGSVVEADPYEQNLRRILNYGHTVGHAIEAASGFELLHGEAVAIGIIAAGLIEKQMQLAGPERLNRIRRILEKLGVPVTRPGNLADNDILELLQHDKKAVKKWPRFVLISDIGRVYSQNGQYAVEISPDTVKEVLKKL
jgi:3-dehydroquinate synthase